MHVLLEHASRLKNGKGRLGVLGWSLECKRCFYYTLLSVTDMGIMHSRGRALRLGPCNTIPCPARNTGNPTLANPISMPVRNA